MTTLGFGLFIDFNANTSWPKLIVYQIICGIGIGPNFQAPLVALQSRINPRDIATSTATFNFLRTIANAISIVIGQVVFQNAMKKQQDHLVAGLGPDLASQLSGNDAAANAGFVDSLPLEQRDVARQAFGDALTPMWIMYTVFSAVAILSVLLIRNTVLSTDHRIEEVGLEAEKRHAADRIAERQIKASGGKKGDRV